jgi:hypothetical protein
MWIVSTWVLQNGMRYVMRSDGVVFFWSSEEKMWFTAENKAPVPGCGPHLEVDVYTQQGDQ